jgi:hypothetical protein
MSRLSYIGRPWVAFDAAQENHRRYFANFQKTGTWAHCPVRFIVADDHGDLVTMIQRRLIDFYVDQEFGDTPRWMPIVIEKTKRPRKNARQSILTAG